MAITTEAKKMLFDKGYLIGAKNDDWKKNNAVINTKSGVRVSKNKELLTEENVFYTLDQFGYGKVAEPFYRGFPATVKALNPESKVIDQILHYWGFGDHSLLEGEMTRTEFEEHCSVKVFEVLTTEQAENVINQIFDDYANSTREWAENVLYFMAAQIKEYDFTSVIHITGAKNAAQLQYILYKRGENYKVSYSLKDILKLTENFYQMKWVEKLEKGSTKGSFVSRLQLTNAERKIFKKMIQNCNCMDLLPCFEKRAEWKVLLHCLHYYDKRLQPLYGKNISVSSKFEDLISKGEVSEAADFIGNNNNLLRKIKYLLSRATTKEEKNRLMNYIYAIRYDDRSSMIPAIQLILDENSSEKRTFTFVHKKVGVSHVETDEEVSKRRTVLTPEQKEELDLALLHRIKSGLDRRAYGSKIFIGEEMDKIALPINLTTSQGGYNTLPSGSIIDLPKRGKVVRLFVYWDKVNDIDLSMIGFTTEGKLQEFSWRNMSSNTSDSIVFSGDETRGYEGGSEFFDIDIAKFKKQYPNVTHLVCCANVYSGVNFSTVNAQGGYMFREKVLNKKLTDDILRKDWGMGLSKAIAKAEAMSGEVYEPKTVKSNLDLTADTPAVVMYALDIENNQLVWLNMAVKGGIIAACGQDFTQFKKFLHLTEKLSVKKYFELLKDTGKITDNPEEATIIISDQKFDLKEGQEQIKSKDFEKLLTFID